ncbi:hypothetical protein V1478_010962, partial [Vespula squamosa]
MGLLESTVTTTECKAKGEAKRESQKRGNHRQDSRIMFPSCQIYEKISVGANNLAQVPPWDRRKKKVPSTGVGAPNLNLELVSLFRALLRKKEKDK